MTTLTLNTEPIPHEKILPGVYKRLHQVHDAIAESGLERPLAHLIMLRASQINACGFCVEMHTREAREDGETNPRLDQLIVWRYVDLFTDAEKAAFAWTEALTSPAPTADYESMRAALREHYSEPVISGMTFLIGMINLWNRMQISKH